MLCGRHQLRHGGARRSPLHAARTAIPPPMDELEELAGAAPPLLEVVGERAEELSVEEIIEQHVGSLGCSQVLHVLLVSLAWVFDAQSTLVTIFADAQPRWRCTGRSAGACPSTMCGLEPGSWEWVGGKRSSTVAEWELICHRKFRAGIPASMFFVGSVLGSAVHGRLADKYLGRKKTIILSCILTSITGLLTSLASNIWIYTLLRFSNGFSRSGIGICCLVLSTEAVGRRWRGQVGQSGFFFFTVGFLSLPVIAYPMRASWRNIYRVISLLPLVYSLLIIPLVSESPRWLVITDRTKEALDVLRRMARMNGRLLPPELMISSGTVDEGGTNESLWSARWAVKRMMLAMAVGLSIGFVYYGVQLNVDNLDFNLYITVAVNALMDIPAVFLGSVMLSFMDRRVVFSSLSVVTGISCFLCIVLAAGKRRKLKRSWGQLAAEAIGLMAGSTAVNVLYVYCVELFPTSVRNFAVSMLRQALMLGAAVAPLMVVLGRISPRLSFVVFGCLAMIGGALTVWLPETRNAPLYETIMEQQAREKKSIVAASGGDAAANSDQVELPKQEVAGLRRCVI